MALQEKRRALISLGLFIFGIFFSLSLIFLMIVGLLQQRERGVLVYSKGIGIVEISGVILSSESVIEQLERYHQAGGIEAIILRIDTPGGSVGAVQEIYDKVLEVKKDKPVVASFGSIAASGGYYIAAAAHKIISNPGTLTGSIGVIMNFADLQKLFEWIRVRPYTIKSGKYKDMGAPHRPMTEGERKLFQGVISDTHAQFVEAIVSGREMDRDDVLEIADGRLFTGRQAQLLGLVDKLGSLSEAIKEAASLSEMKGEPKVVYPPKKQKPGILDLVGQVGESLRPEALSPALYFLMR